MAVRTGKSVKLLPSFRCPLSAGICLTHFLRMERKVLSFDPSLGCSSTGAEESVAVGVEEAGVEEVKAENMVRVPNNELACVIDVEMS